MKYVPNRALETLYDEELKNLTVTLGLPEQQKKFLDNKEILNGKISIAPLLDTESFFIIVGTWEGVEIYDRLFAYKIAEEINKLNPKRYPFVVSDKLYESSKQHYTHVPIITVGGPVSNSFSHNLSQRFGLSGDVVAGIKEVDGLPVGYAWGSNARTTFYAVKAFLDASAKEFVGRL